jgi:hypothetical protein
MTDPLAMASQLLRAAADRPLGDIVLRSNLLAQPLYSALQRGADNLLGKALRALDAGDEEKVERYVRRAVALPYDENEEVDTALFAARMAVHSAVTDLVDEAESDDSGWLDAAEHVLDTCSDGPREYLHRVLAIVIKEYRLPAPELRRLRAALNRHPAPGPDPEDVPSDGLRSDDERIQLVRDALQAIVLLDRAYDDV